MLGVTFGNKHSYWDWGLLLKSYPEISAPKPKTKMVDVPGTNGMLDLSETLTGYVQYEMRKIKCEFVTKRSRSEWPSICSEIYDYLHGMIRDITLDDDPDYFYTGRITIESREVVKSATMEITVEAEVEPFKTKRYGSTAYIGLAIDGTRYVTVMGAKKPVIPTIKASAQMQMLFHGNEYPLQEGENSFPDVVIREGTNVFSFTGNGTVSINYREGRF